ncbi:MAG TPA: substrate-binding domain-containing protein [Acidimicrobiales bacterium]|nr:substrate-binding domain-containing protein [Acidimicrobiales bacterium]
MKWMRARSSVLCSLALVAALAAACGAATTGSGSHGTADVAYAGSLQGLVQTSLQPAFSAATGDAFVGKGAGSTALAHDIMDGELAPGVFVSVGAAPITSLWPSRSHFALRIATDPLVVAYSPKSRDARQLDRIRSGALPLRDLFTLMESPGFRLGRTDPNVDPQGGFFMLMVSRAAQELHLGKGTATRILGTSTGNTVGTATQIYDEVALPTAIASGSVDAGSDFLTEARQYHLDYISLPPSLDFADPSQLRSYSSVQLRLANGQRFPGGLITLDATLVSPPPGQSTEKANTAADHAFLAFLLSPRGQSLLKRAGYRLVAPELRLAPGYKSAAGVLPRQVLNAFRRLGGEVSTG